MPIDKLYDIYDLQSAEAPAMLKDIFDKICNNSLTVKYVSSVPTASTVRENELAIYDDGAGTMTGYIRTGEGNLFSFDLTVLTGAVKVSSNDTTPGYLNGKLTAGTGITLTEGSDGGNETLSIAAPKYSGATSGFVGYGGSFAGAPGTVTFEWNVWHQILINNETVDIGNEWASNQFTATTSGYYLFNIALRCNATYPGWMRLRANVDGSVFGEHSHYVGAAEANGFCISHSGIVYIAATKVLKFEITCNNGNTGVYDRTDISVWRLY